MDGRSGKSLTAMRLDVYVHRVAIPTPVRTAFGEMVARPSLLVRVEDDDGCYGWGEVWCNFPLGGAAHRARLLEDVIAPRIGPAGGVSEPARLWAVLAKDLRTLVLQTGEYGPVAQCLAGLECAAQDLIARRAGQPLFKCLNAEANGRVAVYASGINPDGAADTAARAIAAGFRACKIKIGFGAATDRRNLRDVRRAIGNDISLMADGNQGLDLDGVLSLGDVLGNAGVTWLEEPLPHDAADDAWLALARHMGVPLAAGENFVSQQEFDALPARRGLAVVQPDAGKWGGVARALAVGRKAAGDGRLFCPHWLGGGVGLLTALHVKAAVTVNGGYAEVDVNPNKMRTQVANAVMATLEEGMVRLSDTPGIGVEDDAIAAFSDCLEWHAEVRLGGV